MKRLYRSTKDRKVCGVCGGIAEYFDIDPTLIRLIFALFVIVGGSGILAYIVAAIVISDAPAEYYDDVDDSIVADSIEQ